MAWNEPGGNNNDPWGGRGNRNNDGPPDLDDVIRKFQDKLGGLFGGSGSSGEGGASIPWMLILFLAALIYAFLGVYQVNEQERGVVLRLGVYKETVGPGLHWNPKFIDQVHIENVTALRTHPTSGLMLTEDENIVEVDLAVQYVIADLVAYTLRVSNPKDSLKHATDSALRHVVGSSSMDDVLTEGREQVSIEVKERLQKYLDLYETGIAVQQVNIQRTRAPQQVQAAFDDVIKAREDEQRVKNEAQAYANQVIPEARGRAQKLIEEATAYKSEVVARARGDASRFTSLLSEYQKAPEVTRERLYLDTVQEVMSNTSKVMVDVEGGNNMMYLPLDKIMDQQGKRIAQGSDASQDVVQEVTDRVINRLRQEAASNRRREVRQ
ncbi:FtsH protease activity modulator HflK [Biformimicrobium ophioploci]|uniref:Protein HflK n=1 Tax=Biformimicrobium ophioploci TaxID=3036711 RepID=A0ABQ6LUX1_9GAMM|nr:FtsH protease activity modulator HflK [Microbulbifer sp. NKW57]GMG85879.1 FtsH protease activity modulator HflK [Microbulbifer sp. NKW57]